MFTFLSRVLMVWYLEHCGFEDMCLHIMGNIAYTLSVDAYGARKYVRMTKVSTNEIESPAKPSFLGRIAIGESFKSNVSVCVLKICCTYIPRSPLCPAPKVFFASSFGILVPAPSLMIHPGYRRSIGGESSGRGPPDHGDELGKQMPP